MSRNAHAPRRRLRNRLMLAFATFTVVVAAVFALYVLLFVYTVEDHLFEAMLEREVAAQLQHHRDHGTWATPRDGFMSVVTDMSALPDGMADVLRQAHPVFADLKHLKGQPVITVQLYFDQMVTTVPNLLFKSSETLH